MTPHYERRCTRCGDELHSDNASGSEVTGVTLYYDDGQAKGRVSA